MESKENQVLNSTENSFPVEKPVKLKFAVPLSEKAVQPRKPRQISMRVKCTARKPIESSEFAAEGQLIPVLNINEKKGPGGNRKAKARKSQNSDLVDEIATSSEGHQLAELRMQLGDLLSEQAILKTKEKRLRQSIRKLQRNVATSLLLAEEESIEKIISRIFVKKNVPGIDELVTSETSCSVLWELSRQTPEYEECRKRRRVNSSNSQLPGNEEMMDIAESKAGNEEKIVSVQEEVISPSELIEVNEEISGGPPSILSQILNKFDATSSNTLNHDVKEDVEDLTENNNAKVQQCLYNIKDLLMTIDDGRKRDFFDEIGKIMFANQKEYGKFRRQIPDSDDTAREDMDLDSHRVDQSKTIVDLVSPKASSVPSKADIFAQLEDCETKWIKDREDIIKPLKKSQITNSNISTSIPYQGPVKIGQTPLSEDILSCRHSSSCFMEEAVTHTKWSEYSDVQLRELSEEYGLKFQNRENFVKLLSKMEGKIYGIKKTPAREIILSTFITSTELANFLQTQTDLYEKVLCFQPICLDEVYARLLLEGYSTTKDHLLMVLDSLAIFVSTSGSRSQKGL